MFTIIACIKFVRSELVSPITILENVYVINPYDLYLIKQLVEFKKSFPCRLIGVTMGPRMCLNALRRLKAFGMDELFLISDSNFVGSDTFATSYVLEKAISGIGAADLYAFGEKSIDGETGQVPLGVASRLKLMCYTGVQEIIANGHQIVLNRQLDNSHEKIKLIKPCAICFQGFETEEPFISLMKLKQVKKYNPIVLDAHSLNINTNLCGQKGSKTIVKQIERTLEKRSAVILEGSFERKINQLNNILSGFKEVTFN